MSGRQHLSVSTWLCFALLLKAANPPFTIADLLPEGFDIDDTSASMVDFTSDQPDETSTTSAGPDRDHELRFGTHLAPHDPPTRLRIALHSFDTTVKSTTGQTLNQAMAYMPGDGAKDVAVGAEPAQHELLLQRSRTKTPSTSMAMFQLRITSVPPTSFSVATTPQ